METGYWGSGAGCGDYVHNSNPVTTTFPNCTEQRNIMIGQIPISTCAQDFSIHRDTSEVRGSLPCR